MGFREARTMTHHGRQDRIKEGVLPVGGKNARAKRSNYVKRTEVCTIRVQVSQVKMPLLVGDEGLTLVCR